MERELEQEFVRRFVQKFYRERLIYELGSKKKRHKSLYKLPEMIEKEYIILDATKMSMEDVIDFLARKIGRKGDCYVITDACDAFGERMGWVEAMEEYYWDGRTTALIFDQWYVFLKEEPCVGSCGKWILHHPDETFQ